MDHVVAHEREEEFSLWMDIPEASEGVRESAFRCAWCDGAILGPGVRSEGWHFCGLPCARQLGMHDALP